MPEPASPPHRPCPRGLDCEGKWVTVQPRFAGWDYFFMAIGISSRPVPFETKCAMCEHVWEVSKPRMPR